jgi:hypothetical protein
MRPSHLPSIFCVSSALNLLSLLPLSRFFRPRSRTGLLALSTACLLLSACGGGDGSTANASPEASDEVAATTESAGHDVTAESVTNQARVAAATATAQSTTNACAPVRPFYWEIGDRSAALASGSVVSTGSATVYTQASMMSIASASKWLYATYVVEKRAGVLSSSDLKYLRFQSGYTNFTSCGQGQTVAQCESSGTNGVYTAANDGKFFYSGGHMEKHATLMGLGALNNTALSTEVKSNLGATGNMLYSTPQLAGGIVTSPAIYASFLRRLLSGQLRMGSMLGTSPVCTNPRTCPTAVSTPIPPTESWHYSIGHWVEDDPNVGDGAFSSAGLFGFYPWIDASKTWYGVVARMAPAGALDSVDCGRLIRKAWQTAVAQ